MTCPNMVSERLMAVPSLNRPPASLDVSARSDPAKSTKLILDFRSICSPGPLTSRSCWMMLMLKTVCARDDVSFIWVAAMERFFVAMAMRSRSWRWLVMGHSVRFNTSTPVRGFIRTSSPSGLICRRSKSRTCSLYTSKTCSESWNRKRAWLGPERSSEIRRKRSSQARGTIPTLGLYPNMLYDFPLPVCPYANSVLLYPSNALATMFLPRV
mmetsp:Transcript_12818/g.35539  ORF Transcript_12818/g.35539 Transcript_12818/m.35539 type:complete len:212 (+) Transcript_12818:528-1163(+)